MKYAKPDLEPCVVLELPPRPLEPMITTLGFIDLSATASSVNPWSLKRSQSA